MLLNALIIILRETLEAGVLISVLMSVMSHRDYSWRCIIIGLVAGLCGAMFYASQLSIVSEWFDYAGQEVINASLQYSIYGCLLLVCLSLGVRSIFNLRYLPPLVGAIVGLAVVREGAEIFLFYSAYWHDTSVFLRMVTSGFMGLMIGVSAGALCYYLLVSLQRTYARRIQLIVLSLMAAGMVAQASQLLLQADWLPTTKTLWDMSTVLPEASVLGQLLYATLGYEASPSLVEVVLYLSALLAIPLLYVLCQWRMALRRREGQQVSSIKGFSS